MTSFLAAWSFKHPVLRDQNTALLEYHCREIAASALTSPIWNNITDALEIQNVHVQDIEVGKILHTLRHGAQLTVEVYFNAARMDAALSSFPLSFRKVFEEFSRRYSVQIELLPEIENGNGLYKLKYKGFSIKGGLSVLPAFFWVVWFVRSFMDLGYLEFDKVKRISTLIRRIEEDYDEEDYGGDSEYLEAYKILQRGGELHPAYMIAYEIGPIYSMEYTKDYITRQLNSNLTNYSRRNLSNLAYVTQLFKEADNGV